MYWDKYEFRKKIGELKEDVEKTELNTPAWLWIVGGGLVGLLTSCLKWKRKEGKPIVAKMEKEFTKSEDDNGNGN